MSARVAQSVRRGFGRISLLILAIGALGGIIGVGASVYGAMTEPAATSDLAEWREYQARMKGGGNFGEAAKLCRQIRDSTASSYYDLQRQLRLRHSYPYIYKCDPDAEPEIRDRIASQYEDQWLEPLQIGGGFALLAATMAAFSWLLGWIIAGFIPD